VPMHGKPSPVQHLGGRLLRGLPDRFTVGRYHSLHARRATLPSVLSVAAETDDGVIMAIEHRSLPIAAVQFHPESVMTSAGQIGLPIIAAVLGDLSAGKPADSLAAGSYFSGGPSSVPSSLSATGTPAIKPRHESCGARLALWRSLSQTV